MDIYEKMKERGIVLPETPELGGIYTQVREFGERMYYISGTSCRIAGGEIFLGKFGERYCIDDGKRIGENAVLNVLAVLEKHTGDLRSIKKFVKLLCFVASKDDFYAQPEVADFASRLLIDLFGEKVGITARSAIGVNVLPGNLPFEMELMVELKES